MTNVRKLTKFCACSREYEYLKILCKEIFLQQFLKVVKNRLKWILRNGSRNADKWQSSQITKETTLIYTL